MPSVPMAEAPEQPGRCPTLNCRNLWKAGLPTPPQAPPPPPPPPRKVSVRTKLGFAKEAPVLGISGINVYHKNRLIMPFWNVLQRGSSRGRCVVGVIEANFMEPAHDKQNFERTPLFIRLEAKLKNMVLEYWRDNCHKIGYQNTSQQNTDKGSNSNSHGLERKMEHRVSASQNVVGLSAVAQDNCSNELVINLTDDFERNGHVPNSDSQPLDMGEVMYRILTVSHLIWERREEAKVRQKEQKQIVEELERRLFHYTIGGIW